MTDDTWLRTHLHGRIHAQCQQEEDLPMIEIGFVICKSNVVKVLSHMFQESEWKTSSLCSLLEMSQHSAVRLRGQRRADISEDLPRKTKAKD